MRNSSYGAWERARHDIFEEWQRGTDPANLHPPIRPLFRNAADHVRMHIPADMSREDVDRLAEALEAPWGMRIERAIREVFTPETARREHTTRLLAQRVKLLGLQPWHAPEPLPPVDEEEITLVVWMAVTSDT